MARKKPNVNECERLEESQEFLDVLRTLPAGDEVDALTRLATDSLALFNDAVRGNVPDQAKQAELRYEAVVYRLHGDDFFGCLAEGGSGRRLAHQLAAAPGVVPGWGQGGDFLVEVNDMRIRVKAEHGPRRTIPLGFTAVDLELPFLSPTGFRSHWLNCEDWLGSDLLGAVVGLLEIMMRVDKDWQPVPIVEADKKWINVPAWLMPALEGVTRNGQLAMPLSGRAPVESPVLADAAPKEPKSNAQRQREWRKRQAERRQQERADDAVTISLTRTDRHVLSLGLLAHEDLSHRGPNWEQDKKPEFNALLARLWPQGDSYYLVEPQRTTYRAAGLLRNELERCREQIRRMEEIECEYRAELVALRKENEQMKAALEQIRGELAGTVAPVPVSTSQVVTGGDAAVVEALRGEVASLRGKLERQHVENLNTIAEQGRALLVTERLQKRLKAAGLPHDYRPQLGER